MNKFMQLCAVLVLALPATANADFIELQATSSGATFNDRVVYSDFTILFDDANGDGLLAWNEIVNFSGFTYLESDLYDDLISIPEVAGFSLASHSPDIGPYPNFGHRTYDFCVRSPPAGWCTAPSGGTYSLNRPYTETFSYATVHGVPEPGTLALLAAGLAGIGLSRRRRLWPLK